MILFCCASELGPPRGFKRYRSYIILLLLLLFYMVSMMGDINIVYINIDFLNETFFMTFTLSRILSGLANFSTERSETFRITL